MFDEVNYLPCRENWEHNYLAFVKSGGMSFRSRASVVREVSDLAALTSVSLRSYGCPVLLTMSSVHCPDWSYSLTTNQCESV